MKTNVIISCEHATNHVPLKFRKCIDKELLHTHWAYDIGALEMARIIAKQCKAYFHFTSVSRLIVDCNRLPESPELFPKFIKNSDIFLQKEIITRYYNRYRNTLKKTADTILKQNRYIFHISIHSFTPSLNGFMRYTDVGLQFDQGKVLEAAFCKAIKEKLFTLYPLRIAYNYPFRGCGDGVTVWLRRLYGKHYIGIECEVNQELTNNSDIWRQLSQQLAEAICYAVEKVSNDVLG